MPDEISELIKKCREDIDKIEWTNNNQEKMVSGVSPAKEMLKYANLLRFRANKIGEIIRGKS